MKNKSFKIKCASKYLPVLALSILALGAPYATTFAGGGDSGGGEPVSGLFVRMGWGIYRNLGSILPREVLEKVNTEEFKRRLLTTKVRITKEKIFIKGAPKAAKFDRKENAIYLYKSDQSDENSKFLEFDLIRDPLDQVQLNLHEWFGLMEIEEDSSYAYSGQAKLSVEKAISFQNEVPELQVCMEINHPRLLKYSVCERVSSVQKVANGQRIKLGEVGFHVPRSVSGIASDKEWWFAYTILLPNSPEIDDLIAGLRNGFILIDGFALKPTDDPTTFYYEDSQKIRISETAPTNQDPYGELVKSKLAFCVDLSPTYGPRRCSEISEMTYDRNAKRLRVDLKEDLPADRTPEAHGAKRVSILDFPEKGYAYLKDHPNNPFLLTASLMDFQVFGGTNRSNNFQNEILVRGNGIKISNLTSSLKLKLIRPMRLFPATTSEEVQNISALAFGIAKGKERMSVKVPGMVALYLKIPSDVTVSPEFPEKTFLLPLDDIKTSELNTDSTFEAEFDGKNEFNYCSWTPTDAAPANTFVGGIMFDRIRVR